MSLLNFRIDLLKKSGLYGWSSTGSDITGNVMRDSLKVVDNMGRLKDTFEFEVFNPQRGLWSTGGFISPDDRIRVYLWSGTGSVNTTSDLLIDGVVSNPMHQFGPDASSVRIDGVSFISSLFNSPVFLDLQSTSVLETTQEILNQINNQRVQNTASWLFTSSTNPVVKRGGDSFPVFNITKKYTTAVELLEEVWSDKYTDDGQYLFYVEFSSANNRNELVIQPKGKILSGEIVEGGEETSFDVERKVDEVINTVIFNCGVDAYGRGIERFYFDVDSQNKYGVRWKYVTETEDIAGEILSKEKRANSASFTQDSEGNFTDDNFPTSYPYTMGYNGVVVNSDAEFNKELRNASYEQGLKKVKAVIDLFSNARFFVTVDYPRSVSQPEMTKVYNVSAESSFLVNKSLRVTRQVWSFWSVQTMLEEDELTAQLNY